MRQLMRATRAPGHSACPGIIKSWVTCALPQLHFGRSHFQPEGRAVLPGATSSRQPMLAHFRTATITVVRITYLTMVFVNIMP
jgi:hypothetical protein